ncbi:DM13 domain-containing protein [Candidatus Thiodictyon syntrophicum]|uniref:DM13 domain-containing protein n=1 Tax=Candidatus Thiodictyon syntrophicum TaxID=1166950 RepID=A0A2K8UH40_9GAMM|nr:DM13 domain-containing protein [Candidatus Thiodictyon syntrophicum]AUB84431.1 hypothetical protein THSYN_28160 [Candidatus Thiodictyon syntrophicum]
MNRYAPRGPAPDPAAPRYLLIGLLIGAGLGGVGGFFAYPFVAARNSGHTAVAAVDQGGVLRAAGRFTQADPADRIHYGGGVVSVYDNRVELGEDFAVGPGPKYHLYLVPQRGIDPDTRVEETMFVDLGPLKSFSGAQTYAVPAGVAVGDYGSVVVWCEQFNTLISPAELSANQ